MKRPYSREEDEERLAEEISKTVKQRDERGLPIYPQVLTNPAFMMLQASDAIFTMLQQRPLAMINLIRSHPEMARFWASFPSLWRILLMRVIEEIYGERKALLYPFIVSNYSELLSELPFVEGIWRYYTPEYKQGFSQLTSSRIYHIKNDTAVADMVFVHGWPFIAHNIGYLQKFLDFFDRQTYLIKYTPVTKMYIKLRYLVDKCVAILEMQANDNATKDLRRYLSSIVDRLVDWWSKGYNSGAVCLFFVSECLLSGDLVDPLYIHQSTQYLATVVDELLSMFEYITAKPIDGTLYSEVVYEKITLFEKVARFGKVASRKAVLFDQTTKHLYKMREYFEKHKVDNEDSVDIILEFDEKILTMYGNAAFGPTGFYNTQEKQKALLFAELNAIQSHYGKERMIERLGSHYVRGMTHCGSCGTSRSNTTQAHASLSIAFCNLSCWHTYNVDHRVDLLL